MASTNKIFISFALRDKNLRDTLVEQVNKTNTPYTFIEMSLKQSWEPAWKEDCRSKVKECDGTIALITNNIVRADGQQWELSCAYESRAPVLLLYGNSEKLPKKLPAIPNDEEILDWTLPNIETFLSRL